MKKFSVIVPVFNRPNEIDELLDSLSKQTVNNFEVLIIEDGSKEDCKNVIEKYKDKLEIHYFFKENSGPGDSRNYGMSRIKTDFMIFFDSDCIIPPQYFEIIEKSLTENPVDCYGAPDSAHESFTKLQKAINYAMTSIITTGGVRNKRNKLDNYQPRSFNMGFSKEVFNKVGGYRDIHPGEDPDLSYRIINAGFKIGLIPEAIVYHKRRIDFSKFVKQVYKFAVARTILMKWYTEKTKLVYTFPSLFLIGTVGLLFLSIVISIYFLIPIGFLTLIIMAEALFRTKSLAISLLAIIASYIQLFVYGYGFLKGILKIFIFKQPERKAFPRFFFDKNKLK